MTLVLFSSFVAGATPGIADADLGRSVSSALEADDWMARRDVAATTSEDGIVALSGRVENLATKRRAVETVKHVRGVRAVVDQILVEPRELADATIEACVRRALVVDPVTEKAEIAVSVADGEVGMAGKVSSLAEKRIAEAVVAEVEGVRSIVNQLTVALTAGRPDSELQAEVAALIENSASLADAEIEVTVSDHDAKLAGYVGAAWQIDTLRSLASLPGITSVDMKRVEVDSSRADVRLRSVRKLELDDASIQKSLVRSMRFDPLVSSYIRDIAVEVDNGVVSLSGSVGRLRAKRAAVEAAENTLGVRLVTDDIEVTWTGDDVDDVTIIREASAAIRRSAYLQRHEIRVHCQNAHLQLYGVVDSEFEKQIATWTCDGLKGVVHVANHLAVPADDRKQPADDAIASTLEEKLKRNLIGGEASIDVRVKNGVAIMRGEVDSWQQWQAALNLALESGARKPHSLIRVRNHPPHDGSRLFVP